MDALTAQPSRTFKQVVNNPANPESGVVVPVTITIRGDLQKAESLLYMAPGVLQKMRYENAQHLPDYRKSVVVGGDGGRWLGVIVSQTQFGVESINIYVPPLPRGIIEEVKPLRLAYPVPVFLFNEDRQWEAVSIWSEDVMDWPKPAYWKLEWDQEEDILFQGRVGKEDVTITRLTQIGTHIVDQSWDSTDSGLSGTDWSPGYDPAGSYPYGLIGQFPTPLYGPNLAGAYWNPDTSVCYLACPPPYEFQCINGRGDTLYEITGNLAKCDPALFHYGTAISGYNEFWGCDACGILHEIHGCDSYNTVIERTDWEHHWPPDGIQRRTLGIRSVSYFSNIGVFDGGGGLIKEFVSATSSWSTYTDHVVEGVWTGEATATGHYTETGASLLLLSGPESNDYGNPDSEANPNGLSGAVVVGVDGYVDYETWIVMYAEHSRNYSDTAIGTGLCSASATDWHTPDFTRRHYVHTDRGRHLLWEDTSETEYSDAYVWCLSIYDYHGSPFYLFAYSQDIGVWGDTDGYACYFGLIFGNTMKISDPFRFTPSHGYNIYEAVENWARWNWGQVIGAEVVRTSTVTTTRPA